MRLKLLCMSILVCGLGALAASNERSKSIPGTSQCPGIKPAEATSAEKPAASSEEGEEHGSIPEYFPILRALYV